MDAKLKRKWVKALRSGEYEQGKNMLRSDTDKFCCLGVLCDVQGRRWTLEDDHYAIGSGAEQDSGGEGNTKLRRDVGDEHMATLIKMNDAGKTFSEIADYIERKVPPFSADRGEPLSEMAKPRCDRWNCLQSARERRDSDGRLFGTYCDEHWAECWNAIQEIRSQSAADRSEPR